MRILLFSDFALPASCANATRVINLSKLLRSLGHEPVLLGVAYKKGVSLTGSVDGLEFEMLPVRNWTGIHACKRVADLKKALEAYLEKSPVFDTVILNDVYYDCADVFFAYRKKTGARLIMNSLEWFDRDNEVFAGPFGIIKLIKNRIALKCFHKRMDILAISSLLEEYYRDRGCNTVTIPTIVDLNEYALVADEPKNYGKTVRIAYAGTPGKKDYIGNTIRAMELLTQKERNCLQLHFYGAKLEQLQALGITPEFLEKYKENIVCHGRIPYEQVKFRIAEADFTVLLRPNKRYANAGFPTKVGESMACGTPVIANLTSDLYKYIIDEQTGIICADESPECCAEAFRRVLMLSPEQRQKMRENCLNMAKKAFDYRAYFDSMEAFLKKGE